MKKGPGSSILFALSSVCLTAGLIAGCATSNVILDVTSIVDLFRQKASVAGGDALIGLDFDATGAATASVIRYQ